MSITNTDVSEHVAVTVPVDALVHLRAHGIEPVAGQLVIHDGPGHDVKEVLVEVVGDEHLAADHAVAVDVGPLQGLADLDGDSSSGRGPVPNLTGPGSESTAVPAGPAAVDGAVEHSVARNVGPEDGLGRLIGHVLAFGAIPQPEQTSDLQAGALESLLGPLPQVQDVIEQVPVARDVLPRSDPVLSNPQRRETGCGDTELVVVAREPQQTGIARDGIESRDDIVVDDSIARQIDALARLGDAEESVPGEVTERRAGQADARAVPGRQVIPVENSIVEISVPVQVGALAQLADGVEQVVTIDGAAVRGHRQVSGARPALHRTRTVPSRACLRHR